jgi:predicted peptidase
MGAMATVTSVMKSPNRFAAVAPISGGGGVRKSEALAKLPFFVAAGGTDFGKSGSEALHQQLVKAGVTSTYHEYPDVEHLAVVQIALPEVFAFFDEHAKR